MLGKTSVKEKEAEVRESISRKNLRLRGRSDIREGQRKGRRIG